MPFPGAITGSDLAKLRTDAYAATLFMAVTPNTVVFEALLSAASSTNSYAALPYNTVSTGSFNDIVVGMTVLVHTGDQNAPKLRGRVRKAPTDSILYINESSIELTDGDTITVIDDFDLWVRVPGPTGAFDYDAPFERIPPAISGLQSTYVYHQLDGSISVDFAPVVTAVTKNATISSYLWALPSSWTITVGNTATKDITVTIPDGSYWMHFTATDSNGVEHTLHVQVFCGNAFTATWTIPISDATWQCGLDEGWSGSVTALDDVEDVLDNTRVTLFILDDYAGDVDAINTNIALIGRWAGEVTAIDTDDLYGVLSDVRYQIDGFATQLAKPGIPAVAFDDVDAPAIPGDVEDPTPPRAIWSLLTHYSTAGSLMSFDFLSAYHDYVALDLRTESPAALDAINEVAWSIAARLTFAPSGECRLRRDAVYLDSSTRDTLITIVDMREQDVISSPIDITYGAQTGRVIGGAGVYNTTTKRFTGYDGSAPPISYGSGQETQTLNGQILIADSAVDDARSELSQRIGNHLAALNPKPQIEAVFVCGAFRGIVPSNYDWYTVSLSAASNARGIAYDTATRWILSRLSCSYRDFTIDVSGTLEQETLSTGAKVIAQLIPSASAWALPVLPPLPSYSGVFAPPADYGLPDDLENLAPEDMPPFSGVSVSPFEPMAPDESATEAEEQAGGDCLETLNVWSHTGSIYSTSQLSALGVAYVLRITGAAQLSEDGWVLTLDLLSSNGGFSPVTDTVLAGTPGSWQSSVGWEDGDYEVGSGWFRGIDIRVTLSSTVTIGSITFDYSLTKGNYNGDNGALVILDGSGVLNTGNQATLPATGSGTFSWSGSTTSDQVRLAVLASTRQADAGSLAGSALVTRCVITGAGTAPSGAIGNLLIQGDPFYYRYNEEAGGLPQAYPNTAGMLINGGRVTPYPAYQESHEYEIPFTGTGNQIPFQFVDPDGDYSDNQVVPFIVRWCRQVT